MPELGFYFTESDIADVVQHCIDSGEFLIPDFSDCSFRKKNVYVKPVVPTFVER
jgi:hypothetical protein